LVVSSTIRKDSVAVHFIPIEPRHFALLWEWYQRPHVQRWFAPWTPPSQTAADELWTAMIEGREPNRGYLISLDGAEVGYIESSRISEDPQWAEAIGLGRDAVAADLFLADESLIGRGVGPQIVVRFYLRMMGETGLDVGIIDPEVDNARAIRAYEKAGFRFHRQIPSDKPGRPGESIMIASRKDLERALILIK
jgi:aminoglycoside 6'-N-acetyltransferase